MIHGRYKHAKVTAATCSTCPSHLTEAEVKTGMRRCLRCRRAQPGRQGGQPAHRVEEEVLKCPNGSAWLGRAPEGFTAYWQTQVPRMRASGVRYVPEVVQFAEPSRKPKWGAAR